MKSIILLTTGLFALLSPVSALAAATSRDYPLPYDSVEPTLPGYPATTAAYGTPTTGWNTALPTDLSIYKGMRSHDLPISEEAREACDPRIMTLQDLTPTALQEFKDAVQLCNDLSIAAMKEQMAWAKVNFPDYKPDYSEYGQA